MKKGLYFTTGCAIVAVIAASTGGAALAQDGAAPQPNAGVDDIIVTAQKRAQSINDVGISIVAATPEQLQDAGVTNVNQLARIVPGFSVGNTYSGGQVFSLRGVNFNSGQFSTPPAVSTYVDEALLPFSAMTGGLLLDVERVEVLKGPQGTLFGTNATGGSINIVSAKPTSTASAGLNVNVNNFGRVEADGYINGALSSNLNARLAASTTQFGAWQRGYVLLGKDRKYGEQNKGAVRLLLDWQPTDRFHVLLNVNANYDKSEGQQPQLYRFTPQIPGGANPLLNSYPQPPRDNRDTEVSPDLDVRMNNRLFQTVLRADYEITDTLTLTSLSNYLNYKGYELRNGDGSALSTIFYENRNKDETFSQEIRLSGEIPSIQASYIFGANYQKDDIFDSGGVHFNGYSALPVGAAIAQDNNATNRSIGAFGNVEVEIADGLTLLGGARYTEIKQTLNGCLAADPATRGLLTIISGALRGINGLPAANGDEFFTASCALINDNVLNTVNANGDAVPDFLPIAQIAERKETNVSWRAGVNFQPVKETLIYGLVSRGYKAGLYPGSASLINSSSNPVNQEKLTAYEAGIKLGLFDRRAQLNASFFYYDYRDKQFFTYSPIPVVGTGASLVNVPKSKVKGVDVDLTVKPMEGLTFRGAVAYVDTKVKAFQTFDFKASPIDVSGSEFNFAPPWSGSADVEYRVPVGNDRSAFIGTGLQFANRTFSNLGQTAQSRIPGYTIFDARIGLQSEKGWKVQAYVRNLTNKTYITAVFPSGDTDGSIAGIPRSFGMIVNFNW